MARRDSRDRLGFEEFVAGSSDALQRAAWLLTGDVHLAQDLVQTVLADAWQRWARLGAPGNDAEAYVRRAIYTTYVTWWRRRSFSERPTDLGAEQVGTSQPDAASQVADRVTLAAALRDLSPQQRTVIVLRFSGDCTIEQTARILRMSTSAATTHQARGLARLRASGLLTGEEVPR